MIYPQCWLCATELEVQYSFVFLLGFQYLPSTDVHINKNAKFDPSSKIFEVIKELYSPIHILFFFVFFSFFSFLVFLFFFFVFFFCLVFFSSSFFYLFIFFLNLVPVWTFTATNFSPWQISKRWKLQSVEQQQTELEAKKKAKQEAKEMAKKQTGNRVNLL